MRALARSALAALALGVLAAPLTGQDRGMTILQGTAARYQGLRSLCADFAQHLWTPLLRQERTGEGRLCQARPNLFAMRFTRPDGDVFVVDGESAWYYLPSNDAKQAFRAPVERSGAGLDFHREFLVDPETKYAVSYEAAEDVRGVATHRLRLDPLRRTSYRSAIVWIEQSQPILRQIRIVEENGNERTITLTGVTFDARPPARWFDFEPPPGVLVMEMPEGRR